MVVTVAVTDSIYILRLREVRERLLLSQEELALRSGVSRSTVSRLERGLQEPTYATLKRLASALGVSSRTLLRPAPSQRK